MKKITCLILSLVTIILSVTSIFSVSVFAEDNVAIHDEDALHTEGYKLVNAKGEDVFLKGLNLGGWLIMEDWFTPVFNNDTGDSYTYKVLTERFGLDKAYELINIYQDNWIQETDFKNIADMGFNCVRIPFWYRNFQSDDKGTWILDKNGEIDLSRLEWAVEMCRKYGLYAILDLHGANGNQSNSDHCGMSKNMHFFDQNKQGKWYREQATELWRVIAKRFAGDPAIAMFDLLNEPMSEFYGIKVHSHYWEFYDMAYDAIREEDPDRIITMIGTWSVDNLPDPYEYDWKNVVYQFHQYDKKNSDYTSRIANAWTCFYNVPLFAGEFHPTSENADFDFAINSYNSNDVSWALWTYKGYNSWAAWADWFAYGSTTDEYIVDLENDSYETIAEKWGEVMQTNSGTFYEGQLFKIAKKYLPDAKVDVVPFNTQKDVDNYVAGEIIKGSYNGKNVCKTCNFFAKVKNIPLLGSFFRWIHSLIHTKATGNNIN